jgi:hypothetical protein
VTWKGLFAIALLALGLVWLTAPGLPLYDGVGFPDEPYRYVQPPRGYPPTQPPTVAAGRVPASRGISAAALDAVSAEQGPQVEVYLSAGALKGSPSTLAFHVGAYPRAPGRNPAGGRIDGNIYELTATATPPAPIVLNLRTGNSSWISMRAIKAVNPGPRFIYRASASSPWKLETTERAGNDIYVTGIAGFGQYALAYFRAGSAAAGRHSGPPMLVIALLSTLAALVIAIVAIRLARR